MMVWTFTRMRLGVLASLSAVALAACSTIPQTTEDLLAKPIDCATADSDIEALTEAIPGAGSRARSAVRSILPFAVATALITRDYRDRARVATGRLERDINNKIADIYETCTPDAAPE